MNPSPEANPALAEALTEAEEQTGLRDYINNQIKALGNSMLVDTLEHRSTMYTRKNYTVGALVAFDPEVRRLVSRNGVNLRQFDEAIDQATDAIQREMTRRSTLGEKVIRVVKDLYANGNYR